MNDQFVVDNSSVHLWAFIIEPVDSVASVFRQFLSSDEQLRANCIKFADLRNSYTICRGLVRCLLGRYLEAEPDCFEFHYQAKGKPFIANRGKINFNISHTSGMLLCGVTKGCEIGVDIERLRHLSDMQDLAARFFCTEEMDELMSLQEEQRMLAFYRCWTRKESYLKATGEGLSAPLHSFRVTLKPTEEARLVHIQGDKDLARAWRLLEECVGDAYVATVAHFGRERAVRVTRSVDPLDFLAK